MSKSVIAPALSLLLAAALAGCAANTSKPAAKPAGKPTIQIKHPAIKISASAKLDGTDAPKAEEKPAEKTAGKIKITIKK